MPVTIRLDDGPLRDKLEKVRQVVGNAQPVLELAGNEALQIIAEKFRAEGPGWAPLAKSTIQRRRNKGAPKILQDTGKLRNSITAPQSSAGGVYQLSEHALVIGSNLVYAAIHQFGWPASKKHPPPTIPARPYLPTPDELIPRVEKKLRRYLEELLA